MEPSPLPFLKYPTTPCFGAYGCTIKLNITSYLSGYLNSMTSAFSCDLNTISIQIYNIKCSMTYIPGLVLPESDPIISYIPFLADPTNISIPSPAINPLTTPNITFNYYPISKETYVYSRFYYMISVNGPLNLDSLFFRLQGNLAPVETNSIIAQGSPNGILSIFSPASISFVQGIQKRGLSTTFTNGSLLDLSSIDFNITIPTIDQFTKLDPNFAIIENSLGTFRFSTQNFRNQQPINLYGNSSSILTFLVQEFPGRIVSGNYKSNQIGLNLVGNNYQSTYQISGFPRFSFGLSNIDLEAPRLTLVSYTRLNFDYIIMKISTTDDASGLLKVYFDVSGTYPAVTAKDIVSGTLTNGTFEILYKIPPQFRGFFSQYLYLMDQIGRIRVYSDVNTRGIFFYGFNRSPPLPFYLTNNPEVGVVPTFVRFFINDIDLSLLGCKNIMYFNISNANKDILVGFQTSGKYYWGGWDKEEDMYVIEFYVPPRSAGNKLTYYMASSQFTLYSSDIETILGPSSELRYHTKYIDNIAPLITSLTRYPSDNVTIENDMEIGWDFTITDGYNGFKSGLISVITDLDGYEYNFTVSPSSNQSIYEFNYSIRIPIISDCVSQIFTIRYVTLFDNGDYQSESSNPSNPPVSFMDPLLNFLGEPLSITVTCPIPVTDITPPEITSYTLISPNTINTASYERSFSIEFQVTDSESPISTRHIPKCFATEVNFGYYSTKASKINSTADGKSIFYRCQMNLPYGFGYPLTQVLLSIHGYADNKLNFGGILADDLKNQSREYFINVSFDRNGPSIDSTTDIDTNGGQLTIFGHNFGTINNSVQVKLVYPDSSVKYNNILLISNVVIVIDGVLPNQSYFDLSVITDGVSSNTNQINVINGPPPPIKPKCEGTPLCGGPTNGFCTSNGCQCIYPWYGLDCLSKPIISKPTVNQTKPDSDNTIHIKVHTGTSESPVSLKSLVSIVALNEINPSGEIITTNNFTQWNYSQVNTPLIENTIEYTYSTTIKDTCIVNVTILIFANQQTYIFANERLIMPPSSLKYTIEIFYYPFKSPVNTLQLVMSASLQTSESSESTCSYQQFSPSNGKENGDFMKLQIDTHSLYGRFIKRAIIDNRVQTVTNTMIKSNTTSTNSQAIQLIGINIPSFIQNAVIDPDFSILIDSEPAKSKSNSICEPELEGSNNKGLTKVQLVGVIIGAVGFASVVGIGTAYIFYKRYADRKSVAKILNLNSRS